MQGGHSYAHLKFDTQRKMSFAFVLDNVKASMTWSIIKITPPPLMGGENQYFS